MSPMEALTQIRALCDEQAVGWFEFIVDRATTHIAYVYEDRSVYLPEGREVVDLDDFHLAAAAGKVHRLVRADEVRAVLDAVSVDATPAQGIDRDALKDLILWAMRAGLRTDVTDVWVERFLALVRPVEGVVLSREEARLLVSTLSRTDEWHAVHFAALAARLEVS